MPISTPLPPMKAHKSAPALKYHKNAPPPVSFEPLAYLIRCYLQVLELIRLMFRKCRLVHADLSEYNVLYHEKVRMSLGGLAPAAGDTRAPLSPPILS